MKPIINIIFIVTIFAALLAFFPPDQQAVTVNEPAPTSTEIPAGEISVETSVDGHVSWAKVPFGVIHVVVSDGKVSVSSIPVPKDVECDFFAKQ